MKIFVTGITILCLFTFWADPIAFERKEKLSDYQFFDGNLADLQPYEGVIRYELNTPLFSNYAEKLRFFKLPEGAHINYDDSLAFDFPNGTVLIKNFYFPLDFRRPESGRRIIETRLLVRESDGWQAYPYIWNEEQTEAFYDPAGETRTVDYISASGKRVRTNYVIPNKNQCKGCHVKNDKILPLGPNARQLNRLDAGEKHNQIARWQALGILKGPPESASIPKMAVWDDPATGDINLRARAYLDANCGHCHSRSGPANTSGLFLDIFEKDPAHLGVNKSPIAAGRGAGNLNFDIDPGKPQNSILVFRMKTNDPAIAMPEIGREQIHREGVELIEQWIRDNRF